MARFFLVAGAASGFLSVALGAFTAHALKQRLDAYSLGVFQTAVQYQFYHALALLAVGQWLLRSASGLIPAAGGAFLFGTVVFCGSLYALALTGVKILGAITPFGGVGFLLGWVLLGVAALQVKP